MPDTTDNVGVMPKSTELNIYEYGYNLGVVSVIGSIMKRRTDSPVHKFGKRIIIFSNGSSFLATSNGNLWVTNTESAKTARQLAKKVVGGTKGFFYNAIPYKSNGVTRW